MRNAYQSLRTLNRALTTSCTLISRDAHLQIHYLWKAAAALLLSKQPEQCMAIVERGWELLHAELGVQQ